MKLALAISSLASGGAERVMSQLANYWAARGDAVTLITLDSCSSDCYSLDSRIRRVALGMMGDSRTLFAALHSNCARMGALRRAVIDAGASTVLSFEERTNVLVLLATEGLPLRRVISERTNPAQHAVGKAWNLLRRLTYPLADALVVQTAVLRPWARTVMLARQRVEVIPNPVRDMAAFVRNGRRYSQHTIVSVGRLIPAKGFDVLLTAFARVAPEFPAWNLAIVGEGPERGALRRLAESLGIANRATLTGWLAEPGEMLATASLFVMSSHYEGFPNALVEAMACGLPVISTNWTGSDEIITHELDGLLVPVGRSESLGHAMRRVMGDREMRDRLGQNALAVRDRYKLSEITAIWDAVLTAPRSALPAQRVA